MINKSLLRSPAILLTLCAGIAASAAGALWLQHANQRQAQEALQRATELAADAVHKRMQLYQYGLRGARGVIVTSGPQGLSRALFHRYSQTRDIAREFPGARGFGFIRRVPRSTEASFLNQARADGAPDFAIRQLAAHDGERFVIQYIEPQTHNLPAVGLDIASEDNRRDAALAALRSGEVRITGPITLVQATGSPLQSFLVLLPIYETVTTPDSEEARMRHGIGWSYAPLLTKDVLHGLALHSQDTVLRLSDITRQDRPVLFFENDMASGNNRPIMRHAVERDIFGRRWLIELAAHPQFLLPLQQRSPTTVLLVGILVSLMLATLAGAITINRQRRQLINVSQAKLAAIVESSSDAIIGKTPEGVISSWNRGAERIFGYSAEQAIGRNILELLVPSHLNDEELDILRRIAAGERITHLETQRQRQDGELIEVSAAVSPILDENGRVVGASTTIRDNTRQKAAEARILELNASLEQQVAERTAQLRKSNLLLNNVLDSASEVSIIATDTDGLITLFNRGAERMLGYTAEEMIGLQNPAILHLAEEVAARSEMLSEEAGYPVEGFRVFVHKPERDGAETREWTYVHKSGQHLKVSLAVTAMRDTQGSVVGYLGIALDITQRKIAEKRLGALLETTRAILDTAVNPVLTFDRDGLIQQLNPAARRAFGLGHNVCGSLHELIAPGSRERLTLLIDKAIHAPHTHLSEELIGRRDNGEEFPLQLSLGSMRGERDMLVCVITDLSQQVQLRQELLAARDQLLMAAEVAELGIWTWTLADNSLQWNERMFELYQQPPELQQSGLSYEHWYSRVHPQDVESTAAKLDAAVRNEGIYDPVFRIVRPDGSTRIIQAGAQVERDADGNAIRVTGINLDITAQHEAETRLRESRDRADAANAAKSAFLANMSHEIRTPMNAVLGMLQLVQATDLSPRQLDYVQKARSAAQSLLGLLNDILDYSKIEAGKLHLELHPFELDRLMRDLAIVLAGNQGSRDVEVMFDIDAALPGALIGDSLRLQQILVNLAGNALKFTERGQVVVSLKQLERQDDQVTLRVAVSDTGIGIAQEQLQRIFEGFTQAEASISRRFGGTGLGLVICKRLAELMGGTLQVQSSPGHGSRFWFDITLAIAEPDSLRSSCLAVDSDLRLLVVDDNEAAREILLRTVTALGWHAQGVDSGSQVASLVAKAAEEQRPFDIVLMDWRMPDMDGMAVARDLQQRGPGRTPLIIMITAYGREVLADIQQEGEPPFAAFLTKPATPQQLAETIQQALYDLSTPTKAPQYQPSTRLQGLRVLVVEDNALNRQVAYELLTGEGASVVLADGGQAGIDSVLAEGSRFDAVLMDIQMPDIDGLEATREIRRHPEQSELPIIAMTANVSQSDRSECLLAGMQDHIGKPIDLEQLVSTLLHWTRGTPSASPFRAASDQLLEPRDAIIKRFGGNIDLLRNVLRGFEPEMRKQLQALREHMAAGDIAHTLAALHTLKGSSATMGAHQLSQYAAALEAQLKQLDESAQLACLARSEIGSELEQLLDSSVSQLLAAFGISAPADTASSGR